MHWTSALLVCLGFIATVRAGKCSGAREVSTGMGFAAYKDVAASWEEGSMPAEIKPSKRRRAETLLACTNRCWSESDCLGVIYVENKEDKKTVSDEPCKLYYDGTPTNLRNPDPKMGFQAVAWRRKGTCEDTEAQRMFGDHDCCDIWMKSD